MLLSTGKVALFFGVSSTTIRRWDREGRLRALLRTVGGHRRYLLSDLMQQVQQEKVTDPLQGEQREEEEDDMKPIEAPELKVDRPRVLVYARVSGHKQKPELQTQLQGIRAFVEKQGWELAGIHKDIASGLNEQRPGLLQLLKCILVERPYAILCTFKDRLARFGCELIETFCNMFSTKVLSIHFLQSDDGGDQGRVKKKKKSMESQLVEDVIALLTSFAGKLHRQRRGKIHGGTSKRKLRSSLV